MKTFFLSFFTALLAFVGTVAIAEPAQIHGQWGAQWGNWQVGEIQVIAKNAGDLSQIEIESRNWLQKSNYRCSLIARMNDDGIAEEVHEIRDNGANRCPEGIVWTLTRASTGKLGISFADDIFGLEEAGLTNAELHANLRAVEPDQFDEVFPEVDIMGVKLGMTPEQVDEVLVADGFTKNDVGDYVREPYQHQGRTFHRDTVTPVYAETFEGYDYFGSGRLMRLDRDSKVDSSKSMHVEVMRNAIIDKYGEPLRTKSLKLWAYDHANVNVPISADHMCDPNYEPKGIRRDTYGAWEACSHSMDTYAGGNSENALSSVKAWMRDHDTDRLEHWFRNYTAIKTELDEQMAVFERSMNVKL